MGQINMILTPGFERDLERLMKIRGIQTKSDAIRLAVHEMANQRPLPDARQFSDLLGAGLRAEQNPNPQFAGEDELWS